MDDFTKYKDGVVGKKIVFGETAQEAKEKADAFRKGNKIISEKAYAENCFYFEYSIEEEEK